MRRVAILTDFTGFDEGYSLCRVVQNQCKMLTGRGYRPLLFVREGFSQQDIKQYQAQIIELDLGPNQDNRVVLDGNSEKYIKRIEQQLEQQLERVDVVLTHDLIYQPNQWLLNVAARRVANRLPVRWVHWVHSSTTLRLKAGQYQRELKQPFANSWLAAFHPEEIERKRQQFGYERDQVIILPSPIDFTEDYHPLTQQIICEADLWQSDPVIVYPCRLDRGKQPHIIIEVAQTMRRSGHNAKVVIVDFHSTDGDKVKYRDSLRGSEVYFTSDLEPYSVPHQVVMELLEFSDVFIHPSRSEADGLVLFEAAWKRAGLVLNYDLLRFREFNQYARMAKFSSNVDVLTGEEGRTDTGYTNRQEYFDGLAAGIMYDLTHNPILAMRRKVKSERSLETCGRILCEVIEA